VQTVPLAEAKTHLSALVDDVAMTHDRVTITRHGRAAAVLLCPDELAIIEETLAWLSQPGIQGRIDAAESDFAAGRTMSTAEVLAHARASQSDRHVNHGS